MSKFCIACESSNSITKKDIDIKVGRRVFEASTDVCSKCGAYAVTPELQKKIDDWGHAFNVNFIDIQPKFTDVTKEYLSRMSEQWSLKLPELIRFFTAFYLTRVVERDDFQDLKSYLDGYESAPLLKEGEKDVIPVQFRYSTFKDIQEYAQVWELGQGEAVEEAVLFGIGVLTHDDVTQLKNIAAMLREYAEFYAKAA